MHAFPPMERLIRNLGAPRSRRLPWLLCLALSPGTLPAATPSSVSSPDRRVEFRLTLDTQPLSGSVRFNREIVTELQPLEFRVDGTNLTERLAVLRGESISGNEVYPTRGVHAEATNRYRGVVWSLRHAPSGIPFQLEARVFNDAAAFRFVLPADAGRRTPDEATRFRLPPGSVVWHHDLSGHYESAHERTPAEALRAGTWTAPPVTFRLPGKRGYAALTEAALQHYSGMALQVDGPNGLQLALGHRHPVSYPFRLRYSNDIARVSVPATLAGPVTTPWRVVILGRDLNALVNSDAVSNLCPPPDPALFPQGAATDWIRPGRAVWKYLDGGPSTLEGMKEFSKWAGALGFEHHVIEGFWSRWSREDLRDLVSYSRQQGVGLWFWKHSRQLRTAAEQDAFFQMLQDLGVVGAKIDFFDHEHQEVVDLYGALLRKAAEHRVMLNFHGANKPTGETRTWPNELVREAVRGMESSKLQARARHDATLPFTRLLAGPADYTPVHFGARRGDTTWAHQVATAVVFTAPLLTYAAHPTNLLHHPCTPLLKTLPAVWDETVVLPVSEIGELAAFARRRGPEWFLGLVNGSTGREVRVPLRFLPSGVHDAQLIRDDPAEAAAVKSEARRVRSSDTLTIRLSPGGGFAARFSRP